MSIRAAREHLFTDPTLRGVAWCRAYAAVMDDELRALWKAAEAPDVGMALVAVGGYGRAELSPQSDIDVVLLHRGGDAVGPVAEKLWYPIWDEGLKLGHAVRTVKEAVALAADDRDTATSLLSIRLVAGDASLAADLTTRAAALWRKRSKRWLSELSASVRDRHAIAGEVSFLLEPELKEGRGGLRDVHAIHWAEQAESIMLEGDDVALDEAYQVVLAARVELHRRTGRTGDRLLLQEQDAVAEALGFAETDDFMRSLSAAARTIAWTSDETWARVDSSLKGPSRLWMRRDKPCGPGIILREELVHLTADADPARDGLLILRAAVAAAQHDTRIERRSLDRLAAAPPPLPYPWSQEARDLLAELLLCGPPAIAVIETLDQRGLWSYVLPEWESVRFKPQRNAFHTYTVDRHLCVTATNTAELTDGVDRPDLLAVGALLHDIGKGYPGDHTEVGIEVIAAIGERLGYPPADIAVLQDMVRHHLLLAEVATRRDLSEDSTIEKVVDAVGSRSMLHLLAALTEADSKATGPSAWNSWKAGLLHELVSRADHLLGGGSVDELSNDFPTPAVLARMAEGRQVIEGADDHLLVIASDGIGMFSRVAGTLALNGLEILGADAYSDASGMAANSFHVTSSFGSVANWPKIVADVELALAGRLAISARLADRARTYGRTPKGATRLAPPSVHFDNDTSASATVVEVHCPDSIGLLYRITRALAELELDLRAARIGTLGPEVIDAFYVCDAAGNKITDTAHLAEIERALLHALVEVATRP
jgi:[protein-PII] uridylyltransferase